LLPPKLARLLVLAIRFVLESLAVQRVAELGVKRVIGRTQRDCLAERFRRPLPLLAGEALIANRDSQ